MIVKVSNTEAPELCLNKECFKLLYITTESRLM